MMKVLYLGLDPKNYKGKGQITHYPIIKIVERDLKEPTFDVLWRDLILFSTVLFTSQNTVHLLLKEVGANSLKNKTLISVGKITAKVLSSYGLSSLICENETAEGIISVLSTISTPYVLYLHSKRARALILDYLIKEKIKHFAAPLYNTLSNFPSPIPTLSEYQEIVFTSPSTVDSFLELFTTFPHNVKLTAIGPITRSYLSSVVS